MTYREILNIENFGIRLHYTSGNTYLLECDHPCAPLSFIEGEYETLAEALGDIANRILNPNNVYDWEELPDNIQRAYLLAGIEEEGNPAHPEVTDAVATFLQIVLEGIATKNMRRL